MKTLETQRVILRQWQLSDSRDLYEYSKSPDVGPNAGWPPHKLEEESKEIIQFFIDSNDTYAIVLQENNKVIGSVGIHERYPDETLRHLKQRELGFVLNPKYWGLGIMPEVVNYLIDYGFNELGLDIIWCGHFDFNLNSKRVQEKCGFKYRFTSTKVYERLDNKEISTLYYSLFNSEYLEKK